MNSNFIVEFVAKIKVNLVYAHLKLALWVLYGR